MKKKLTKRQQEVYNYYVNNYDVNKGYPTYTQASKDLNKAPSVIYASIKIIIRKWYATKDNQWKLLFKENEDRFENYALSWLMESRVWPTIAKAVAIGICDLAKEYNKSIEDVVMDIVTED